MTERIFFVTGTDTGVGKTVFAAAFTRYLRQQSLRVAALKPICSGGRGDARRLSTAAGSVLALDEVNPWHFRAPLAPLLAARMEGKRVRLARVVAHVRAVKEKFSPVVIEGAGGLLSPLGEDFNSRDLIAALRATPIIVCPNRLGAVNQILLNLEALPAAIARRAQFVLVNPPRVDRAAHTNAVLLEELAGGNQVHVLEWLGKNPFTVAAARRAGVLRRLGRLWRICL